jgi:fructoselysine 6-kinase
MAGESVRYYGAVADDEDGAFIRSALVEFRVDVGGLVVLPGSSAVTLIRIEPDGDRVFEREDFGVTADYAPTPEQISEIAEADWVQIGMLPQAGALRAQLLGARIGQDCAVSDGFDGLTVAFGSVGADDPAVFARDALGGGAELAVVTRGALGAIAYPGTGGPISVPAVPASIVDTTGAGDSFIAGFIAATARGTPVEVGLFAGASWAAVTCGHRGGFPQKRRRA